MTVSSDPRWLRRFVVLGRRAAASPDFSLEDLPSTSGRLDVLLRCVRAALLVSHGVRRDTVVYLALLGGARAPRSIRIEGELARFLRPDERSLATTLRKSLVGPPAARFAADRNGISVADGGLDAILADLGDMRPFLVEEGGPDVRGTSSLAERPAFFLGDHLGFDDASRARLLALGAASIGLGPVSLHTEDAIALLHNELDRRVAGAVSIVSGDPDS